MLPCKTEASLSFYPSPSSSHSSLSLEPLSPPASGCLLPESLCYTHLFSPTDTDIPSLLDRPSSLSPLSGPPCSPFTVRKRPASFLSEHEKSAPLEGILMGSKRICESEVGDGSIVYRSSAAGSLDRRSALQLENNGLADELLDGSIFRNGCAPENVASKDLDDMLDLLLQETEVVPALTAQSKSIACQESSLLAYKSNHCKEEREDVQHAKLASNHVMGTVQSMRMWSDMLQDGRSSLHKRMESITADDGMGTQELRMEPLKANARRFSEELMKQIASTSGSSKQEQIKFKEEKLQGDQSETKQQVIKSWQGASGKWVGPTLLDIESALASTSPLPSTPSLWKSPSACTRSSFLNSIKDIFQQQPSAPHFLSSFAYKEEPLLEEDDKLATWRRLQKRNLMEPRYTVKIRCQEEAVNDGYRWRKYGQKSIKNSPYPRSYYRCSSGKCSVKKQVERSGEDAGLLLVSYEGIHLHHRPTSLLSPTIPHMSAAPSSV